MSLEEFPSPGSSVEVRYRVLLHPVLSPRVGFTFDDAPEAAVRLQAGETRILACTPGIRRAVVSNHFGFRYRGFADDPQNATTQFAIEPGGRVAVDIIAVVPELYAVVCLLALCFIQFSLLMTFEAVLAKTQVDAHLRWIVGSSTVAILLFFVSKIPLRFKQSGLSGRPVWIFKRRTASLSPG